MHKMICVFCGETFYCSGQKETRDGQNPTISSCFSAKDGKCTCPSCYLNRLKKFEDLDKLTCEFLHYLKVCWNVTSREEMMILFIMGRIRNGSIYKDSL